MLEESDYQEILQSFPPVYSAFAYGSGAIPQGGYEYDEKELIKKSASLPMFDMIFVVEDSEQWHLENFKMNPSHYNFANMKVVSWLQDQTGAGMWFNAMIPMNIKRFPQRLMKYGVIQKDRAMKDLLEWSDLYIAGRLHKPVAMMKSNPDFDQAVEINRDYAVKTALLLLPNKFEETNLYSDVASLSYIDDPRMYVSENPNKIRNLVLPNLNRFKNLYSNLLEKNSSLVNLKFDTMGRSYFQEATPIAHSKLVQGLPPNLKKLILPSVKIDTKLEPTILRGALGRIVSRAARTQSVKGVLSAGVLKSSRYLFEKIRKRIFASTL